MRAAAAALVLLLAGCAWIGGGCEVSWEEGRATCVQGGGSILIMAPARAIAAAASLPQRGQARAEYTCRK